MDKETKNIFVIISILVIVAIVATYYRTIIRKDYILFPDETAAEESSPADEDTFTDFAPEPDPIVSDENEEVSP